MGKVIINVCCGTRKVRLVPFLGIPEEAGQVRPTPQYLSSRKKGKLLMGITITDSQKVNIEIRPLDTKNNPAPVEDVKWMVDNSEMLALQPSDDGLSCIVSAVGPLGKANVSVTGDAQIGPGEDRIAGVMEITVVAGQAKTFALVAGTPEEQTPPSPPAPPPE